MLFDPPKLKLSIAVLLFFCAALYGQTSQQTYQAPGIQLEVEVFDANIELFHWSIDGTFLASDGFTYIKNGPFLLRFNGQSFSLLDTLPNLRPEPCSFAEDRSGKVWLVQPSGIFILENQKLQSYSDYYSDTLPFDLSQPTIAFAVGGSIHVFEMAKLRLWRMHNQWECVLNPQSLAESFTEKNVFDTYIYPQEQNLWWIIKGDMAYLLNSERPNPIRVYRLRPDLNERFTYCFGTLCVYTPNQGTRPLVPPSSFTVNTYQASFIPSSPYFTERLENSEYTLSLSFPNGGSQLNWEAADGSTKTVYQDSHAHIFSHKPIKLSKHGYLFTFKEKQSMLLLNLFPKQLDHIMKGQSVRQLCFFNDHVVAYRPAKFKSEITLFDLNTKKSQPQNLTRLFKGRHLLPFNLNTKANGIHFIANNPPQLFALESPGAPQLVQDFKEELGVPVQGLPINEKEFLTLWEHGLSGHEIGHPELDQNLVHFPLKVQAKCLLNTKNHGLWIGTNQGLYNVRDQSFSISRFNGKPLQVRHLYADPHGFMYMATQMGLLRWRIGAEKPERIVSPDVMSKYDKLHSIYPDQMGRLWVSSDEGLFSLDTNSKAVSNYGLLEGLSINEFNYLAHLQGPNGRLYFGGINGLVELQPDSIPALSQWLPNKLPHLRLVREEVILKNETLSRSITIAKNQKGYSRHSLPKNVSVLKLSLDQGNYAHVSANHFWRIPESDSTWHPFNLNELILLYQLPSGAFSLELKTVSRLASTQSRLSTYYYYKEYPYSQNPWFISIFGASFFGLVYLFYRWRTAQIKKDKIKLEHAVEEQTYKLRAQNLIIGAQYQKLNKIDEAKSRLFKNINHEFRTPLSVIQTESQLLRDLREPNREESRHFAVITQQTQHLNQMLNDLMDLSTLDSGVLKPEKVSVDWPIRMLTLFSQFEGLARKKHLAYQLHLSPKARKVLVFDYPRFERIAVNLITNALKFTQELGEVEVRIHLENGQLIFSVQDNGPGISAEEQKSIFKRYEQGEASKQQSQAGFGIGLSLAQEYAQILDGNLTLDSKLNQGSTFTLSIPIDEQEGPLFVLDQNPETEEPKIIIPSGKHEKAHILIAEDHPQLLKNLSAMLSPSYKVSTALNGALAYQSLKADPSIDLILSDALMPHVDGFELLQKARQNPQLKHKPFVLLTALSEKEDRLNGLRLGVDAFMTKPFDKEELLLKIKHLLKQQQERRDFLAQLKTEISLGQTEAEDLCSFDETWLKDFETLVNRQLNDPRLKVAYLADQLYISERTLFNKVKAYTGLTPSEYLRKCRLKKAQELLKARHYSTVKEVAYAVGFQDPKNFRNRYKAEFGHTPRKDFHGD